MVNPVMFVTHPLCVRKCLMDTQYPNVERRWQRGMAFSRALAKNARRCAALFLSGISFTAMLLSVMLGLQPGDSRAVVADEAAPVVAVDSNARMVSKDSAILASMYPTPFEQSQQTETADYQQAIQYYGQLADASALVQMREAGLTDSGRPLHVVLVSGDGEFDVGKIRASGRSVLLVNNAIHPGEPDGVDASMSFVRDLAFHSDAWKKELESVVVAVIPVYNIGGALNRNSGTRANQNGPPEYGFRGNSRNFDLNRDFIKCDTRNARAFIELFRQLDPEVLIDTHVSNGADYQHVMTLAHSQKDKLGHRLGDYLQTTFEPLLLSQMIHQGIPAIPYVNSGGRPPDEGFSQFLETPRYSTGYAGLFQTLGFMSETHMLKPYPDRVAATRRLLDAALRLLAQEGAKIRDLRRQDRANYPRQAEVAITWELDRQQPSRVQFHGYEASLIDSRVTAGKRLFYDRSKPFVKDVVFYNKYRPGRTVTLPAGYLIPQGWHNVIALMKLNQVEMTTVSSAVSVPAEVYRIDDVQTQSTPFEGHYFHNQLTVSSERTDIQIAAGDMIISLQQPAARFVVETLEPEATDSLFRWNYFDSILQRKEHFSPYVFEDTAAEMLANDHILQQQFEQRKRDDADFAASETMQLEFLYQRSKHAETAYRRYPVVRLMKLP